MASRIPPDDDLISAWHSNEPTATLAERLRIPNGHLNRQWSRLKAEGRLPDIPRMVNGVVMGGTEGETDGCPAVDSLWNEDALLERLWEEFPDGPREDLYPGLKARK
jgi:hypothetical protein